MKLRIEALLFLVLNRSEGISGMITAVEKQGICVSLTASLCELPLHQQIGVLNAALHFASSTNYRFVASSSSSLHERACPLLSNLFLFEASTLRSQSRFSATMPVFRAKCDEAHFVPPRKMCAAEAAGSDREALIGDDDAAFVSHARKRGRRRRSRLFGARGYRLGFTPDPTR